MPSRLRENSLACIDQNDGQFGGRGARRHIAGVLFVPRCIRNDELATPRGEVSVRNIDGDALLALCAQSVSKLRKIYPRSHLSELCPSNRTHLVFIHIARVIQQPPDQSRLTIIHATRGVE